MTDIAERLDQKLKSLPPAMAASVERLIWDVLQVVESPLDGGPAPAFIGSDAHGTHIDTCLAMAAELDWSAFERPDQGVSEIRDDA